ncbi:hypothetical protein GXB78_17225 [Pseudomonas moraviensis subsp. stanleyae]|uniref:hypothetical protein n=1 Tax=Pseudomonas moraviensis TaxID=321662 RepID=UPI002E344DC5|nr:hypothetical protein [Pseudomonas moraviensis]MED7668947.1 hypothetical protein [Pseudomonas moraviensis subsp. stanleyae]
MLNINYVKLGLTPELFDKTSRTSDLFTADFSPAFPPMDRGFVANRFIYKSLTDDSISLIGQYVTGESLEFVAIILPLELANGPHPIVGPEQTGVTAFVAASGLIYDGIKGELTIKQTVDAATGIKTATGGFTFHIKYVLETHTVKGKFNVASN